MNSIMNVDCQKKVINCRKNGVKNKNKNSRMNVKG